MNCLARAAMATITLTCISTASQAVTTVNFNDLISAADGLAGTGMAYSSSGLTFTSPVVDDLQHWGSGNPFNADPGGAALLKFDEFSRMTVTRTGGGAFDLISLQLAESESGLGPITVEFRYTNALGTVAGALEVTVPSGLQTFMINQPGITSFALGPIDFQLDNVVYDVAAIPEPETFALFAAGLLGLCWGVRRKGGAGRAEGG